MCLLLAMDRINYLLVKEAKIIAMTCTHAALWRKDFVELSFKVLSVAPPHIIIPFSPSPYLYVHLPMLPHCCMDLSPSPFLIIIIILSSILTVLHDDQPLPFNLAV